MVRQKYGQSGARGHLFSAQSSWIASFLNTTLQPDALEDKQTHIIEKQSMILIGKPFHVYNFDET